MKLSELAEKVKAAGGCQPGQAFIAANPDMEREEAAKLHPDWALWAAGERIIVLAPERLDACANAKPWVALQYGAELLTPERREICEKEVA